MAESLNITCGKHVKRSVHNEPPVMMTPFGPTKNVERVLCSLIKYDAYELRKKIQKRIEEERANPYAEAQREEQMGDNRLLPVERNPGPRKAGPEKEGYPTDELEVSDTESEKSDTEFIYLNSNALQEQSELEKRRSELNAITVSPHNQIMPLRERDRSQNGYANSVKTNPTSLEKGVVGRRITPQKPK
jgi:hypothetical protein